MLACTRPATPPPAPFPPPPPPRRFQNVFANAVTADVQSVALERTDNQAIGGVQPTNPGVGIGVAMACLAVLAIGAGFYIWRRRTRPVLTATPPASPSGNSDAQPPQQSTRHAMAPVMVGRRPSGTVGTAV
jgi:hypothetical protein